LVGVTVAVVVGAKGSVGVGVRVALPGPPVVEKTPEASTTNWTLFEIVVFSNVIVADESKSDSPLNALNNIVGVVVSNVTLVVRVRVKTGPSS
jgi:hypothetical protein